MVAGIRSRQPLFTVIVLAVLAGSVVAAAPAALQAAETPRRGGILLAVIGADPPTLDPHQESTFATIQLVAPLYSTLLQYDPYGYPKIIGDLAAEWKIAPDGLTYTFKIRPGIRFHDGSPLTAADVKATYEKIVSPPAGVLQHPQGGLHGGRTHRGPRRRHGGVQAQVPVGLPPGQPGLAVERDLSEEVSRQGPQLLQDERRRLRPVQVQELHARRHVRGGAEPRLLRQGPSLSRRLQVLHQPGDERAGGRHPVGARVHRVPRSARGRGGGDPQAARRQGRRPGNAHDGAVGDRHQQHGEAVHRRRACARRSPWASIATRRAGCSTRSRVSGTWGG